MKIKQKIKLELGDRVVFVSRYSENLPLDCYVAAYDPNQGLTLKSIEDDTEVLCISEDATICEENPPEKVIAFVAKMVLEGMVYSSKIDKKFRRKPSRWCRSAKCFTQI